jgi:hypothetical protein
MSWLDAHQVFFIEIMARDRVNDLRSTAELATMRAEANADTPRAVPDTRPGRVCSWVGRRAPGEAS